MDTAAIAVETAADAIADGQDEAPETGVENDAEVAVTPFDLQACHVLQGDRIPLGEASGVAMLDPEGTRLLIVADSGNEGRALVIDRRDASMDATVLPLGSGAGDDVEGLSRASDGRIFGLTSNGQLRAWTERAGGDFELVHGPRAVSADEAWVCDPFGVNCGPNYEGLCLHPAPAGDDDCAGWAASKARGVLVCLVRDGEGYRADPDRTLAVTDPERLSGCAFEPNPPHRLIVAGNLYSGSALWTIDGREPPRELPERGAANQEALVLLPDGELQSFGDAQDLLGDVSPRVLLACPRAAPSPR